MDHVLTNLWQKRCILFASADCYQNTVVCSWFLSSVMLNVMYSSSMFHNWASQSWYHGYCFITNPQEIYTSEETYLSKLKMLDEVRNILYSFHCIDGLGIQACWWQSSRVGSHWGVMVQCELCDEAAVRGAHVIGQLWRVWWGNCERCDGTVVRGVMGFKVSASYRSIIKGSARRCFSFPISFSLEICGSPLLQQCHWPWRLLTCVLKHPGEGRQRRNALSLRNHWTSEESIVLCSFIHGPAPLSGHPLDFQDISHYPQTIPAPILL